VNCPEKNRGPRGIGVVVGFTTARRRASVLDNVAVERETQRWNIDQNRLIARALKTCHSSRDYFQPAKLGDGSDLVSRLAPDLALLAFFSSRFRSQINSDPFMVMWYRGLPALNWQLPQRKGTLPSDHDGFL
jgi:hypothetical protein